MDDLKRIRLFSLVCISALAAAACYMSNQNSNSRANAHSGSDESSSSVLKSPGSDPKGEFQTVAKNLLSVGSFHCRLTSSVGIPGMRVEPMRSDVDFVKPDRYWIRSGADPEKIVIGKVTYEKKDNKWMKTSDDGQDQIPGVRDAFSDEVMRLVDDVQYLGEESENGETLMRYSVFGKSLARDQAPYESRLWIFKQTALPAKLVIDYHDSNSPMIQMEYSYPLDIKIEAPILK